MNTMVNFYLVIVIKDFIVIKTKQYKTKKKFIDIHKKRRLNEKECCYKNLNSISIVAIICNYF